MEKKNYKEVQDGKSNLFAFFAEAEGSPKTYSINENDRRNLFCNRAAEMHKEFRRTKNILEGHPEVQ